MKKIHVVIITGGDSLEAESSWKSAHHIYDLIDDEKISRFLVSVISWRWEIEKADMLKEEEIAKAHIDISDFSIIIDSEKIYFDVAFISIHGYPGETGHLQGYFDLVGLKYVGSGVLTSAIATDKYMCNKVVQNSTDLKLIRQKLYDVTEKEMLDKIEKEFGYPCIIKPNSYGSGIGVALVIDEPMLDKSLKYIRSLGCNVLVEEFVEGRELTVGALIIKNRIHVLPIVEIFRPTHKCKDGMIRNILYTNRQNAEMCIDPKINRKTLEFINKTTIDVGEVLNCKSFYRVDYILDNQDEVCFLEVNTIPGMTSNSVFTKQIEESEYDLDDIYKRLIEEVVMSF